MKCPYCKNEIKNGDLICSIDGEIAHERCSEAHAKNETMKNLVGISLDELHAVLETKH